MFPYKYFDFLLIVFSLVLLIKITKSAKLDSREDFSLDEYEYIDKKNDEKTIIGTINKHFLITSSFDKYWNKPCIVNSDCSLAEEVCDSATLQCKCAQFHERIDNKCVQCPGYGAPCPSSCCYYNMECIEGKCICDDDIGYSICPSTQATVFITASQIALSAALIMGIAALVMVIYRLCTKPQYLTARHRAEAAASAQNTSTAIFPERTSYLRASLTSMQIRVLSRLRDRPPAYENQVNTISGEVNSQESSRTIPMSEAPPPYEGQEGIEIHLPPPYTEVISNPDGYVNPSYLETETNVTITRLVNDVEPKSPVECCSSSK